jgi:hypothetical protein
VKAACPVWTGGKAVRPYLSVRLSRSVRGAADKAAHLMGCKSPSRQWPDADGEQSRGLGRSHPRRGSDGKVTAALQGMPSREERSGWRAPLRACPARHDCSLAQGAGRPSRHGLCEAPPWAARGAGRCRGGRNGPRHSTRGRGRGPSPPGRRRRETGEQVLRPAGADRHRHSPGGAGMTEAHGGWRTAA